VSVSCVGGGVGVGVDFSVKFSHWVALKNQIKPVSE